MSDRNSAVIAYGINLGGPSTGWKVREADAVGLTTAWAEDVDLDDNLEDYLPSLEHLGVKVVQYGDYEAPSWLLATVSHDVDSVQLLDLSFLQERHDTTQWDATLRQALQELGLTPHQQTPCWLAGSSFS